MAHLNPVPLEGVQENDNRERFEHCRRTRGFTPNSIMTMVRQPDIVCAFTALNQAVLYKAKAPCPPKPRCWSAWPEASRPGAGIASRT